MKKNKRVRHSCSCRDCPVVRELVGVLKTTIDYSFNQAGDHDDAEDNMPVRKEDIRADARSLAAELKEQRDGFIMRHYQ